ncbi:MAG: hypothetical protein JO197_01475 [Acidobacteria bacterium]|nr:hypothetical protein [Acidobacteriota bacterium]MBV9476214.1 hypothetical protein [Acidobacteriota bacterium]
MIRRALAKRWFVFLATVVVHALSTRGRALASPDTTLYIQLSDGFLRGDPSQTFTTAAVRWTKTLYLLLLTGARVAAPVHWMALMVAFNVICSGIVAVLLVGIALRASRSAAAPLVAWLAYLGCYELVQWLPFVLTDLMFCAAALVPFALVARRILEPATPPRPWLLAISLAIACFCRPPGALLIPLVLFAELVLVRRTLSVRAAAAIILGIAAAALIVRTAVVYEPARWPFRFVRPKLEEFSGREKTGEVVYDRKETFRPPPKTAADHVTIEADRFARFFQFTSSAYSRAHNLTNAVFFVPLYALGIFGAIAAIRGDDRRRRAYVAALLVWIGVYAYFFALTVLDYDWRFRVPLIPHFILLAACGVDALAVRRQPIASR